MSCNNPNVVDSLFVARAPLVFFSGIIVLLYSSGLHPRTRCREDLSVHPRSKCRLEDLSVLWYAILLQLDTCARSLYVSITTFWKPILQNWLSFNQTAGKWVGSMQDYLQKMIVLLNERQYRLLVLVLLGNGKVSSSCWWLHFAQSNLNRLYILPSNNKQEEPERQIQRSIDFQRNRMQSQLLFPQGQPG